MCLILRVLAYSYKGAIHIYIRIHERKINMCRSLLNGDDDPIQEHQSNFT